MKKRIRLTESDLHRIVNRSVKQVLREAAYDMNSPEYKQMYDNGDKWYDDIEDDGWEDQYSDGRGNIIQSRGEGRNKEWRTIPERLHRRLW